MTAQNDLTNTLRFSCPSCRAELAVPVSMAGIEGPCPSCYETIRAPSAEIVPTALIWDDPPEPAASPVAETVETPPPIHPRPLFPPVREQPLRPIPPMVRSREDLSASHPVPVDRGFRARLAILPAEEPLDDSWKERHRDQRRSSRRARRVEKAAQSFLESRSFRFVRVGLILASGFMLAFLFNYLRSHQWRLPGVSPPLAEERSDPGPPGKARPPAGDANELVDDDAEIPPVSGTIPSPPRTGGQPVSGSPR